MSRYIDADKMRDNAIRMGFHSTTMTISEFINLQPTADVRPVIKGKWIESTIPNEQYVCSVCGGACWYYDYMGSVAKSKFCPNCGSYNGGDTE